MLWGNEEKDLLYGMNGIQDLRRSLSTGLSKTSGGPKSDT